jgi:hypothetical protein
MILQTGGSALGEIQLDLIQIDLILASESLKLLAQFSPTRRTLVHHE